MGVVKLQLPSVTGGLAEILRKRRIKVPDLFRGIKGHDPQALDVCGMGRCDREKDYEREQGINNNAAAFLHNFTLLQSR
jgi:hypothetical protein